MARGNARRTLRRGRQMRTVGGRAASQLASLQNSSPAHAIAAASLALQCLSPLYHGAWRLAGTGDAGGTDGRNHARLALRGALPRYLPAPSIAASARRRTSTSASLALYTTRCRAALPFGGACALRYVVGGGRIMISALPLRCWRRWQNLPSRAIAS